MEEGFVMPDPGRVATGAAGKITEVDLSSLPTYLVKVCASGLVSFRTYPTHRSPARWKEEVAAAGEERYKGSRSREHTHTRHSHRIFFRRLTRGRIRYAGEAGHTVDGPDGVRDD